MGISYQPDVIESGQSYATILSTPLILGLYTSDAPFLYKGHCEADLVTPEIETSISLCQNLNLGLLVCHNRKWERWGTDLRFKKCFCRDLECVISASSLLARTCAMALTNCEGYREYTEQSVALPQETIKNAEISSSLFQGLPHEMIIMCLHLCFFTRATCSWRARLHHFIKVFPLTAGSIKVDSIQFN